MRTHPLLRRSAVLLAVIAVSFAASTAVAAGSAPLAQEQYYSSYSAPDVSGALAQEQYLESYGEPRPRQPAADADIGCVRRHAVAADRPRGRRRAARRRRDRDVAPAAAPSPRAARRRIGPRTRT